MLYFEKTEKTSQIFELGQKACNALVFDANTYGFNVVVLQAANANLIEQILSNDANALDTIAKFKKRGY